MKLLNYTGVLDFISKESIESLEAEATEALHKLLNKTGEGSEFTGWVDYPYNVDNDEMKRVIQVSERLREQSKSY